jgi:inorganic triphosphatase YgiF
MKSDHLAPVAQEIELKLALPTSDPSGLAARLASSPVLARRKSIHQHLYNTYYDTPEQDLRQAAIALRIRTIGDEGSAQQWLQTLKIGGNGDSALSQRGEWESAVTGPALSRDALKATPWRDIDPKQEMLAALAPCFVTCFDRTSWLVRGQDGSSMEVALDIGRIEAGAYRAPICELELELLSGKPASLFKLAQKLAHTVAVVPANRSKSERGYALAQNAIDMPRRAKRLKLSPDLSLPEVANRVLQDAFAQFTVNLNALCTSDETEVVHQARVGWRRFKSALRLFKPALAADAVPTWEALEPLLTVLGDLRDLDVARIETLPPLADAYTSGDARRASVWQEMTVALEENARLQRKAACYALQEPAVGSALLSITQWLVAMTSEVGHGDDVPKMNVSVRRWAKRRIVRLRDKLHLALMQASDDDASQHRVRILAKRLRYGIEALYTLLPKRHTEHWHQQASDLQTAIGLARDVRQVAALVARMDVDRGLTEFLRGVAVARQAPPNELKVS